MQEKTASCFLRGSVSGATLSGGGRIRFTSMPSSPAAMTMLNARYGLAVQSTVFTSTLVNLPDTPVAATRSGASLLLIPQH